MSWIEINKSISKSFEFENYSQSIDFINSVAVLAEKENHHPNILIGYCKVTITLSTHDIGDITEKDYNLAKLIDCIKVL
jgi:4a-hydroxytetrahydrobiopterin dehydratase